MGSKNAFKSGAFKGKTNPSFAKNLWRLRALAYAHGGSIEITAERCARICECDVFDVWQGLMDDGPEGVEVKDLTQCDHYFNMPSRLFRVSLSQPQT